MNLLLAPEKNFLNSFTYILMVRHLLLAPEKKPFIDPIKKKLMLMNEPATCS
jgi:hypothetical protein